VNWSASTSAPGWSHSVTEHVHDCVVVGAGPAGSAAALQMARDGLDVVLLERGTRPGEKNVMSGVLITRILHSLIPDFRERAPLQRCITGGYGRHLLRDEEVLVLPRLVDYRWSRHPHPQFTVFRSEFDAWFAQEAVDAGAELFTETLVEDLLWEEGRVAGVRTRRGDLRARLVVGADGVNSIVNEKAGLRDPLAPEEVSLLVRQILDLPSEQIEDRFALRPGEGALSAFVGYVTGPNGSRGEYYTELYTNRDSLSMTTEVRLDVLRNCGVAPYDALAARERHPYIARLIQGTTLREYQAHLLPWGGVSDLSTLFGDGVLLAGDAGKFNTSEGVGSWPSMASGLAAARTARHAFQVGDASRETLAVYLDYLEEAGLGRLQRESRFAWDEELEHSDIMPELADRLFLLARRWLEDYGVEDEEYPHSLMGQAYYGLLKPVAPWYVRWPLNLAAWADTSVWRRQQAQLRGRGRSHGTGPSATRDKA
jgi:electron transfer flavoprotein-quinone oxidoreductase